MPLNCYLAPSLDSACAMTGVWAFGLSPAGQGAGTMKGRRDDSSSQSRGQTVLPSRGENLVDDGGKLTAATASRL